MQKKFGVATLVSAKVSFKAIIISRDKQVHWIMITLQIYQEDKVIPNLHAWAQKQRFRKQKLPGLERKEANLQPVGYFSILSVTDQRKRQIKTVMV